MDWLIALSPGSDAASLAPHGRITATLPPRLLLFAPNPGTTAETLRTIPAVAVVATSAPPGLTPPATPTEQMFMDGWAMRLTPKSPTPGEGLPWDSPGYDPP